MKILKSIMLWMCLLCSQFTPFTPLAIQLNSSNKHVENTESTEINTEIPNETPDSTESQYSAIASNFITVDLEGYCTINIPLSHFSINSENSTNTYKQIDYYDNKTRLYMSYVTGMDTTADVPGYIANEVAGMNTVTNDKIVDTFGDNEWIRIKSDHQEDDCNVYVWYILNKDSTSAFWVKAKVAIGSDDQSFKDIMTQTLSTYYLYAVSGTLFETPTTGVYKNQQDDNTVANTTDYQANSDINNVIKSRGGYVLGAKISNNWDSMEIILDEHKFSFPSTLADFTKAGYKIIDISITDDSDLDVMPSDKKNVQVQNKNGTVVTLIGYNDDASSIRKFSKCKIVGIVVDSSKFINVAATDSKEVYNKETAASEMTAKNAKDNFNHELILPGGITWGIYTDDLKAYYGACKQYNFDESTQCLEWTQGNKKLLIRTGPVHQINYIEINGFNTD